MENDNAQNPFYNEQADSKYSGLSPRLEDSMTVAEVMEAHQDIISPATGLDGAEAQVRLNEDASLQDKEYSFDEDNTGSEEYHDAVESEFSGDLSFS